MAKRKKTKKKKFDQSFRKSTVEDQQQSEQTPKKPAFKPDYLDTGTRIGFILMGYVLFIAGSIGCLIMGFAGTEKKGSYEVKLIGGFILFIHICFLILLSMDAAKTGILPIKGLLVLTMAIPVIYIIVGLAGIKTHWGNTLKTIGVTILIPHVIAFIIINPSVIWDSTRANEIVTKANINLLKSSFEKYGRQHDGTFPQTSSGFITDKVIKSLPLNPFTNGNPMADIKFGDESFPGNFTYLPVTIDGKIKGFYLLGYGSPETPGEDVDRDGNPDHVIATVKVIGGLDKMSSQEYNKITEEFPTLELTIKQSTK